MVSLKHLALLGAQLLLVASSPVDGPAPTPAPDIQSLRQTNRMTQVEAGYLPPGPVALSKALAKYRKTVPTQVKIAASSAAASETARVQASDLPFDKAYLVNVTVGHAHLLLDFDTGSSDLWVFSTALPASMRANHHLYGLGGTRAPNENWSISYGDGSGMLAVVMPEISLTWM
jgi:hypothetical protein